MIARSRKTVSHFLSLECNRSMFCSQLKDPSLLILEQKAYLASKIISKISDIDLGEVYKSKQSAKNDLME